MLGCAYSQSLMIMRQCKMWVLVFLYNMNKLISEAQSE